MLSCTVLLTAQREASYGHSGAEVTFKGCFTPKASAFTGLLVLKPPYGPNHSQLVTPSSREVQGCGREPDPKRKELARPQAGAGRMQ